MEKHYHSIIQGKKPLQLQRTHLDPIPNSHYFEARKTRPFTIQPGGVVMIYIRLTLDVIVSLILAVFLMLAYYVINFLNIIVRKYQELISPIRNQTVVRWYLDAGLAGNELAKHKYNRLRIICPSDIPDWLMEDIQRQIDTTTKTLSFPSITAWANNPIMTKGAQKALLDEKVERRSIFKTVVLIADSRTRKEKVFQHHHLLRTRVAEKMIALLKESPFFFDQMRHDLVVSQKQRYEAFYEVYYQLLPIICSCIWLQDFLSLHPCALEPHEEREIVRNHHEPWDIAQHPTIRTILQAESELCDLFDRYDLSIAERAQVTRKLVRSTITKSSLRKVAAEIVARQPKATPTRPESAPAQLTSPSLTHPTPRLKAAPAVSKRQRVSQFVRNCQSLTRAQQNSVMHLILQLDNGGFRNAWTNVELLQHRSESELLPILELQYHEMKAARTEVTTPDKPIRPVLRPKLPFEVTPDKLLDKMRVTEQVDYSDITRLRRLVSRDEIPSSRLEEALAHLICFSLAHEGHIAGFHRPYRIQLRTLVKRYAPPRLEATYSNIIARLVSDGTIVHRHANKQPAPTDPVKLAPATMHKYH